MSKSGDGADRTIFSTKSLKTFDPKLKQSYFFLRCLPKYSFPVFQLIFTVFPEQSPFVETNTKCSFSAEFFGNNWKKTVEKMILYYCGETMMATHRDHIVTMMKRRWGWCWTRRWTRVWARRSRRRWWSRNRKPWCHCPPTVITSSPSGRREGVRCLCGRGVWWQAFGFDFRLIATIGTIFILLLVNTAVK